MAEKAEFSAGLLIGGLIGLGLGLLFAPKPGSETREELGGRAQDVSDRVRSRVRESAGEIATKMKDSFGETSHKVRGAYERGRDAMQQKRQDMLETIESNEEN
ncbi:MAG TPA: YtxH domain-containing protein [bacterium]|nr:YtxH domain-containing protein [bacterium]